MGRRQVCWCLCTLLLFSSCERGINYAEIEAMPDGAAKDSAMLYYYQGLQAGDKVRVEKSTDPERNVAEDERIPIYLISSPDIKRNEKNICQVFRGDTLQILGEYRRDISRGKFMQKTDYSEYVKVRAIKNGKSSGEGWIYIAGLEPLQHNWAYVFYHSDDTVALLFIFGGLLLVFYLLWKLIYWIIEGKIRKKDCFWQGKKIYFKAVYLLMSALAGLVIFYVTFNDALVNSLKFNPDFFAHFSEYPFLLKLLPVVTLLWLASAIGMLCEMINKFRTFWLIVYFPGIWSIGWLIISLVFVTGWLIYIILPTVIIFIIMIFAGKTDDATGGVLSGGGNKKRHGSFVGYNVKGEGIGDHDRKNYPNVVEIP